MRRTRPTTTAVTVPTTAQTGNAGKVSTEEEHSALRCSAKEKKGNWAESTQCLPLAGTAPPSSSEPRAPSSYAMARDVSAEGRATQPRTSTRAHTPPSGRHTRTLGCGSTVTCCPPKRTDTAELHVPPAPHGGGTAAVRASGERRRPRPRPPWPCFSLTLRNRRRWIRPCRPLAAGVYTERPAAPAGARGIPGPGPPDMGARPHGRNAPFKHAPERSPALRPNGGEGDHAPAEKRGVPLCTT